MAIADTTIISPTEVDSRRPLKKSTVVWLMGLFSVLVLTVYYVPRMLKTAPTFEESTATKTSRPSGSEKEIDKELADLAAEEAKKREAELRAEREREEERRRAAETGRLTGAVRPEPLPGSGAPKSVGAPAASPNMPEIDEIEVQARLSKTIVSDGNAIATATSQETDATANAIEQQVRSLSGAGAQRQPQGDDSRAQQMELMARLARESSVTSGRASDAKWLKEYADMGTAKSLRPTQVRNPYTLIQGKVIPAVLGRRLVSDLPGDVTAITSIDVFDSLSGQHLLIPKGSVLVGQYSNQVRDGQDRLMFAFKRIVLPNGISFDLPAANGQDQMGMAGVVGDVNNHYFRRIASGLFAALLADKLERNNTAPVTNIGATGPSSAAGQVLVEMAKAETSRNAGVPPTITVPEGTRINVQVVGDMEFPGAYKRL